MIGMASHVHLHLPNQSVTRVLFAALVLITCCCDCTPSSSSSSLSSPRYSSSSTQSSVPSDLRPQADSTASERERQVYNIGAVLSSPNNIVFFLHVIHSLTTNNRAVFSLLSSLLILYITIFFAPSSKWFICLFTATCQKCLVFTSHWPLAHSLRYTRSIFFMQLASAISMFFCMHIRHTLIQHSINQTAEYICTHHLFSFILLLFSCFNPLLVLLNFLSPSSMSNTPD